MDKENAKIKDYELKIVGYTGVFNAHCKNTVFKYSNGSSKLHPTAKNINLLKDLITDNTNENDIVFDPLKQLIIATNLYIITIIIKLKRVFYRF